MGVLRHVRSWQTNFSVRKRVNLLLAFIQTRILFLCKICFTWLSVPLMVSGLCLLILIKVFLYVPRWKCWALDNLSYVSSCRQVAPVLLCLRVCFLLSNRGQVSTDCFLGENRLFARHLLTWTAVTERNTSRKEEKNNVVEHVPFSARWRTMPILMGRWRLLLISVFAFASSVLISDTLTITPRHQQAALGRLAPLCWQSFSWKPGPGYSDVSCQTNTWSPKFVPDRGCCPLSWQVTRPGSNEYTDALGSTGCGHPRSKTERDVTGHWRSTPPFPFAWTPVLGVPLVMEWPPGGLWEDIRRVRQVSDVMWRIVSFVRWKEELC